MAMVSCTWHKVTSVGDVPCSRVGHSIILSGEVIYLFGGSQTNKSKTQCQYFNDLYEAHAKNDRLLWKKFDSVGIFPNPRDSHAMCLSDGCLYVFGGKNELTIGKCLSDVYKFDVDKQAWKEVVVSGPLPQAIGFSAKIVKKRVFVFGGLLNDVSCQDMYLLNLEMDESTPIRCTGQVPPARYDHGCEVVGGKIYLFGGTGGPETYYNDLYSFETESFEWTKINLKGLPPHERAGHSFAAHRDKDIYIYGGYGNEPDDDSTNRIYKISIGNQKWKQPLAAGIAPPYKNLRGHSSIIMHSTMYIFGGVEAQKEVDIKTVFALRFINPSFRKPVIEYMLNDFCKQSDSLPLSSQIVDSEFYETETQQSLFTAAQAEIAQAKQAFENDRLEMIKLLERQRHEVRQMIDQHQKQNDLWWKEKVDESDAEREKLRRAWEEIEVERSKLNEERIRLQQKAKQVSYLLQQLT